MVLTTNRELQAGKQPVEAASDTPRAQPEKVTGYQKRWKAWALVHTSDALPWLVP